MVEDPWRSVAKETLLTWEAGIDTNNLQAILELLCHVSKKSVREEKCKGQMSKNGNNQMDENEDLSVVDLLSMHSWTSYWNLKFFVVFVLFCESNQNKSN